MGKVTTRVLPADHPIFTGGWSIATVKKQSQKIKAFEKAKKALNPTKEGGK
jgi:hypothetical protein